VVAYVIRSEECKRAAVVDSTSEVSDNYVTTEASAEVNKFSHIQQDYFSVDPNNADTISESYSSLRAHQTVTDQKPPLMKKGKPHKRNVKSLFQETAEHRANDSRSLVFSDSTPVAPRSVELVRRKIKLPWPKKKKKKAYMPGEETSRWQLNFESWRSSSQMSLDTNIESVKDLDSSLRRTASQSDLHNIDTISVAWTDSDTDTASDDVAEESVNDRGICRIVLVIIL